MDKTDRKILKELDRDSRQSLSEIGRRVRLSKEVVQYRVKKLVDDGVIKNFTTVIDSTKLGYILFRCLVRCQNLTAQKEKEIIKFLEPRVGWVVNVRGNWDFNIAIWTKNVYRFMEFWTEFYLKFSDVIVDYKNNPIPHMWIYQRNWLLPDEKSEGLFDLWGSESQIEVDEIDRKILRSIVVDARKPTLEIASELGVSEGTVRFRLKRLEKQKVILRYSVFLDTAKLGMRYIKLHFHVKNVDHKKVNTIREFARFHPNIIYANTAVGGHFLEFDLNVESHEKLYWIIDEFKQTFPQVIREYEFFEYTQEHKFEYLPKSIEVVKSG